MWRKKVVGISVVPWRERVLRLDECMIFESASFISLLNLFQSQRQESSIEKHSRQEKGSRRKAGSDVLVRTSGLFIVEPDQSLSLERVMALTEDWMVGFWASNWWIPRQVSSFLRVILENSCLRLGRRNEEETRAHCLSEKVSSPSAAITLSMISCGISSDFAMSVNPHNVESLWVTVTPSSHCSNPRDRINSSHGHHALTHCSLNHGHFDDWSWNGSYAVGGARAISQNLPGCGNDLSSLEPRYEKL